MRSIPFLKLDRMKAVPTLQDGMWGQIRWKPGDYVSTGDTVVAIAKDDSGDLVELDLGSAGGSYTDEQARDAVAAMLAAGTHSGVTVTNNDGADSMSLAVSAGLASIWGGWITGNYYTLSGFTGGASASTSGNALTADQMHASLFPVPVSRQFDQVGITVSSFVAASTIRLGVYAVGSDGLPGSLIADWGTVASTSNGDKTLSISWTPVAGWYYLVCSSSHNPSTPRFTSGAGVIPFGRGTMTHASVTDWTRASAGSASALPASFGGTPTATGTHRPIWLRAA